MTDHPSGPEITTVGDDFAVVFFDAEPRTYDDLKPGTTYTYDGVTFRTLERPPGERLSTIVTVNDVHFGETICGLDGDNPNQGDVFTSQPGEPPYPETMNAAVVEEIAAIEPDLVVVKGDLTGNGTLDEYEQFLAMYQPAFGDRLVHIRGNHDSYHGGGYAEFGPQRRDVPGASVALIDTARVHKKNGYLSHEEEAWLDDLGAAGGPHSDTPVLVMGHHHIWPPTSSRRSPDYFGLVPDDSERLIDVFARRPRLAGYFAGHTHRNRVRRFADRTQHRPFVEVACVKDFPGAWAEYRVFEGGILQIVHRAKRPDAVAWTDRTRGMFGGLYPEYAFGALEERCFRVV
ncbi:MAG TPA: metallophosphoesterase [Acidimicrobiales bacterium]|nr:metallophosphoesterase [Acidimicrobiales bacterium]